MGDSDDEYDRKRRDKFRGERSAGENYRSERRGEERRRDDWADRNPFRGRPRADYRGEYRGPRERYSPGRDLPPPKRMRPDWGDDGRTRYGGHDAYGGMYGWPHDPYPMHGGHAFVAPPPVAGHPRESVNPSDMQTQPPMMTLKQFLDTQDDGISDSEVLRKYSEYKLDFKRQQLNEFFVAHKDEEWFKNKYHPEESLKRKDEQLGFLKNRVDVFSELLEKGDITAVSVDTNQADPLLRLLDTVVIKLEGGTEEDLKILDEKPNYDFKPMESKFSDIKKNLDDDVVITEFKKNKSPQQESASWDAIQIKKSEPKYPGGGGGDDEDWDDGGGEQGKSPAKKEGSEWDDSMENKSKSEDGNWENSIEKKDDEKKDKSPKVSKDDEDDDSKMKKDENGDSDTEKSAKKGKKEKRNRSDSESSDSSNGSGEKDEKEKNAEAGDHGDVPDVKKNGKIDGVKDDEEEKDGAKNGEEEKVKSEDEEEKTKGKDLSDQDVDMKDKDAKSENDDSKEEKKDEEDKSEEKEEKPETIDLDKEKDPEAAEENGPRALHRTSSIFLRNLAPTITKAEIEAVCKRYSGFLRVAIADPLAERRWFRRGWVTFKRDVNIKEICWNLNNIRLRDCELGAIVNRDLSRRVRPVNGLTAHKTIVRSDIKLCANIAHNLDEKFGLWVLSEAQTESDGKESDNNKGHFGFKTKNPVLQNITDYLIEEASAEEDELLGLSGSESKEGSEGEMLERDPQLISVLDKLILYLRIVHSVDFYNHCEYPYEDEMPNRCGIIHARGPPPQNKVTNNDIQDYIKNFETKMTSFLSKTSNIEDDELKNLGAKDPEAEVEKFIQANTQELAKDKWLCPLSGKKFKGPEFIRKHIFNKHGEKVDEVRKEVEYFNNYLKDPKRPQLPEHPGNTKRQSTDGGAQPAYRQGYGGPMYPAPYAAYAPPMVAPPRPRGFGNRRDLPMEHQRRVIGYHDLDAPFNFDGFD